MKDLLAQTTDKAIVRIESVFSRSVRFLRLRLSPQQRIVADWHSSNPTGFRGTDFSICSSDVVVDGGGYMGQWCSDIAARYNPTIVVFEPVLEYSKIIERRFAANPKVRVVHAALSSKEGKGNFSILGDASRASIGSRSNETTETSDLVDLAMFLKDSEVDRVRLLKLNIEGGEYDLLEGLIKTGAISSIDTLLVQFHDFEPSHRERRLAILDSLAKDFDSTFSFPFVWESFDRRTSDSKGVQV